MNEKSIVAAYFEGKRAFLMGEMKVDCPYRKGTDERKNWREGWTFEERNFLADKNLLISGE